MPSKAGRKAKAKRNKAKAAAGEHEEPEEIESGSENEETEKQKGSDAEEEKPETTTTTTTTTEGDEKEEGEGEVEVVKKPARPPQENQYCAVCSFPGEYCEYSGMLEECKPWLAEHFAKDGEGVDDLTSKVKDKKKNPEGVEKMLPGGKVKKKAEPEILISQQQRAKRKCVTSICGLDLFDVKLDVAAKDFKKTFSCGASVTKNVSTQKDQIEIQGEFIDGLLAILEKKYKQIPKKAIFLMQDGKKVAAH